MLALLIIIFVFASASATIVAFYKIRKRTADKERHRLLAKRKFEERDLLKPRVPEQAPEPYMWRSED